MLKKWWQAEHHARALQHTPGVHFYRDERRGRVGILTTLPIKHAMCTLTNAMLREGRICCTKVPTHAKALFLCLRSSVQ